MSLNPSRFSLDETANQNWTLTVEAGTTLDDVLKPEFLSNVAAKMRPYDRVRVRIDTGEWYAELLVLTCGRAWAKLIPIFTLPLMDNKVEEMESDALDQYFIKFQGPHLKFCVLRKSDKEIIKEQCETKQEAHGWLTSYLLTL